MLFDSAADNFGHPTERYQGAGGDYTYYVDVTVDYGPLSEAFRKWKREASAAHARGQRLLFENPFKVGAALRCADPSQPARLLTGRRTRVGRTRNAARQLPLVGVA